MIGLAVGGLALTGGLAYGRSSKPVISGLKASPATVSSGDATTVTASVSGAKECKLSANKHVASLPARFSCESGSVSRSVTMPINAGTTPVKYKLFLTAFGRGSKKAHTVVTVTTASYFTIEMLQRIEGESSYTTSELRAKAGQTVQYEIVVENTGSSTLKFAPLKDKDCEDISPSTSSELGAGESETFTCEHTLGAVVFRYVNKASIEVKEEAVGMRISNGVAVATEEAIQVAAGGDHTCALLSSGYLGCWGDNADGQLGDGSTEGQDTPEEVDGITEAAQVTAGAAHTCALLSSGHVDCWGDDADGQLGNGTTGEFVRAVEVPGLTEVAQVAAGGAHTCARLASGHVECWGENEDGQLGNATTTSSDTPVEVQSIGSATQVAAGGAHTCAISSDRVQCWGENTFGQLGNATTTSSDTPVEVQG
jgi:Regulator of chromosome condensation (RCC1) repeat